MNEQKNIVIIIENIRNDRVHFFFNVSDENCKLFWCGRVNTLCQLFLKSKKKISLIHIVIFKYARQFESVISESHPNQRRPLKTYLIPLTVFLSLPN